MAEWVPHHFGYRERGFIGANFILDWFTTNDSPVVTQMLDAVAPRAAATKRCQGAKRPRAASIAWRSTASLAPMPLIFVGVGSLVG